MPERTLTFAEINDLTGDDVSYWLSNPFLDRESLGEKVRWWITTAVEAAVADVVTSPGKRTCPDCHAGLDSAEHHAECVAPLDQLEEGA